MLLIFPFFPKSENLSNFFSRYIDKSNKTFQILTLALGFAYVYTLPLLLAHYVFSLHVEVNRFVKILYATSTFSLLFLFIPFIKALFEIIGEIFKLEQDAVSPMKLKKYFGYSTLVFLIYIFIVLWFVSFYSLTYFSGTGVSIAPSGEQIKSVSEQLYYLSLVPLGNQLHYSEGLNQVLDFVLNVVSKGFELIVIAILVTLGTDIYKEQE